MNLKEIVAGYRKRTIARDLTLGLTLTIVVVVVSLSSLGYLFSVIQAERDLDNQATDIVEKLADVLAVPVWNLNETAITQIAEAYQQTDTVVALRVLDDTDVPLYEKTTTGAEDLITKTRPIIYNGVQIGLIEISLTKQIMLQARQTVVYSIMALMVVVILAVVITTQILLHLFLTQPLARLTQGVDSIASGDYNHLLPPVKQSDINVIIQKINVMATQIAERDSQLRALIGTLEQRIVEQKRAEEALRESEERYRSLFEDVPVGLYRTTPAGQVLDVNPALVQMFGAPDRETLLATDAIDFYVNPEARKQWRELMEREGIVRGFETQFQRDDGTIIWVRNSSQAVRDDEGRVLYYEGTLEDITERKRVEEEVQRLGQQRERLLEVSQAMLSTLVLDEVIQQLLQTLREVLRYDTCGLYWLDEATGMLQPSEMVGQEWLSEKLDEWTIPLGQGITGAVARSGQGELVNNAHCDPRSVYPAGSKVECEHLICLPVQAKEMTLGVFNVARKADPPFTEEEFDLVQLFIAQATSAIYNARLYAELEQRAVELSTLLETARAVSSTLDLEEVLVLIAEQMVKAIGVTGCTLSRWDQEADAIVTWIEWRREGSENADEPGTTYALDDFPTTRVVLEHCQPRNIVVTDPNANPAEVAFLQQAETRSLLMLPLAVGERVIGLVELDEEEGERIFTPAEIRLCQALADQAAVAIENARLYGQAQQEIVERERADQALRESEARYRSVVEDQTECVARWLSDSTLTFVNESYCRYFKRSGDELVGSSFFSLVKEEDRESIQRKIETLTPENPVATDEHRVILPDGSIAWQQWTDRAIFDEEGQLIEYQSVGRDITERRRLEEQLRQAQKMEAIGRLAGGVAHDFNNLLTAVMGYTGLVLEVLSPNDPIRFDIEGIQKTAERATNLTRQLLAFARKQVIHPTVLNLNDLILNVDKMLRRLIGEDIELVTLPAPNLGQVKADPGQLEQVLLNLAVNARDAMPRGGKLTIETANITLDQDYASQHVGVTAGEYVLLAVSDIGIGMTEEVKAHLFEPFFTTKEEGKGTGLGLATCFGIVKQNGGHIKAYSEVNRGTSFKIYLPRLKEAISPVPGRAKSGDLPRGAETVLLVEDESSVRELASRMLRQQGYNVLEAANGDEALRVAGEYAGEEIHLLLTDVVMPRLGGTELADQLKVMRPDIKVLFTSGYTDNAIVHHGVLEPGIAFLPKPFSSKMLVRKVREVLDS